MLDDGYSDHTGKATTYHPKPEGGSWWQATNWFKASADEPEENSVAYREPDAKIGSAVVYNRFVTKKESQDLQEQDQTISLQKQKPKVITPAYRLKQLCRQFGLDPEVFKKLRDSILLPVVHPNVFKRLGVQHSYGVLITGASGSGKTSLTREVLKLLKVYSQEIDAASLVNPL